MRILCAFALGAALALAACSHTEVRHHAAIDTAQKTIAVSPYKRGLMSTLVKELAAAGWRVTVDPSLAAPAPKRKAPAASTAQAEEKAGTTASGPARPATRYRMTADFRAIDYCRGGRLFIYDFAIIDNESGAKAIEIGGRECERDVIAKFKAAIAGKRG